MSDELIEEEDLPGAVAAVFGKIQDGLREHAPEGATIRTRFWRSKFSTYRTALIVLLPGAPGNLGSYGVRASCDWNGEQFRRSAIVRVGDEWVAG